MKLNRKKLYQNDSVIYLGTHIDKTLIWKHHIINVAIKLSKANTRLFKIRHYINMKTLKQLFMQFLNHTYLMLLGRKNSSSVKRLHTLQKITQANVFSKQISEATVRRCSSTLTQSLLFDRVAGLKPETLLKKRSWHGCFPVNFCEIFKKTFFYRTPLGTAPEIYSHRSSFQKLRKFKVQRQSIN